LDLEEDVMMTDMRNKSYQRNNKCGPQKTTFSPSTSSCQIDSQAIVEIQQEDPSENYAPSLGWSLRLFLGGSLFIDDVLFIHVCQLLLSLNNSWTINN
jgi:hypothetical protein